MKFCQGQTERNLFVTSSRPLNQKGFTLIELVMVIVLIGTLSALALPKFVDMREDAEQATVKQFIGAINTAAMIAYGKLLTCDHYLATRPGSFHLGTFVRLDGNPPVEYGTCPDPFSNGAAHSMDVISLRSDLMNDPSAHILGSIDSGGNFTADNYGTGDHMAFVTKAGHTIDISFDANTRTVSWTADPVY